MGIRAPAGRVAALLLVWLLLIAGGAAADPGYVVTVTGSPDKALVETVRQVSELVKRADEPPPPAAVLRQRAERDRATLSEALRALGYYDDKLMVAVDDAATPMTVTITVEPGPRYTVGDYTVTEVDGAKPRVPLDRKTLGVPPGAPAAGSTIVDADRKVEAQYAAKAYPFAKVTDRRVVIDHATRSAAVTLQVDPGAPARAGAIAISGLERVSEAFVRRRLALQEGQPLTSVALDKTRTNLVETGLFATVRVEYPPQPPQPDAVPVSVTLSERSHHSIGAGVSYSTNFGPGINGTWENRNLFHDGEKLSANLGYAERQKLAALNYRQPDVFADPNQALLLGLEYRDEQTTDTFAIRRFLTTGAIERKLWDTWKINYGAVLEEAHVTRHVTETDEHLIGFPVTLTRDTSGDLLNPTHGGRLTLQAAPYLPVADQPSFLVLRGRQTFYHAFDTDGRWVGAVWGELGSILGPKRDDIPFSRRFYVGGGSSVRGYGYQLAGPVDRFKDPVGGASEVQLGTELRIKITEEIGIVPFVEAGSVYDTAFPEFQGRLFAGGGIGARYYTSIGPIRLDLAVPFRRRAGIDDPVQFYISIGQAF
jgi:translocation and assembly module TamA